MNTDAVRPILRVIQKDNDLSPDMQRVAQVMLDQVEEIDKRWMQEKANADRLSVQGGTLAAMNHATLYQWQKDWAEDVLTRMLYGIFPTYMED